MNASEVKKVIEGSIFNPTMRRDAKDFVDAQQRALHAALYELIAIKEGKANVPPEKSYGDWSTKKITTLKEAQEHAEKTLDELNYKELLGVKP